MEHSTKVTKISIKAVLLATVMAVPGTAIAQNGAAQETSPCDRLIETLRQGQTEGAAITMEQAEAYQENDNTEACETALRQLEDGADEQAAGAPTGQGAEGEQTEAQQAAGQQGEAAGAEIEVDAGAPAIQVQQPAPDVTVRQDPPTVRVDQGQPEIVIHQPAPIVNVEIPRPQITLRMPDPQVSVSSPEPEVSVQQAEPQVEVVRPAQEQQAAQVGDAQQPIIRYDAEEPEVNVSQTGEAQVQMERQASQQSRNPQDDQRQRQMAARQQEGQTTAQQGDRQQQASRQPEAQQSSASEGDPVAVNRLKGLDLTNASGDTEIGQVAMVIVDAQRRPFVVVDRGDDRVAVHVNYLRVQGDRLVLVEEMPAEDLPVIEDSALQSDAVQELGDDNQIRIRSAS